MKEELQAQQYHNQIEEEEFDDEIEESEEEVITLDFDNGVAIQEGIIVGQGLYDKIDEIAKQINDTITVAPSKPIAKGMAIAYEMPEEEPATFTNIVETPEGYDEAAKEAELVEKVAEKVKEDAKPSYRDKLTDVFVEALANRAVRSLMDAHYALERDIYDELYKKHSRKLGGAFEEHQQAMLKSIDKKQRDLKKAYGFGGRVSAEHIPDWAKPYVENYMKNFVYDVCDLMGDAE